MQDAARETLAFMDGKTREDLANNRMLVLAVVKDLEIIGNEWVKLTAIALPLSGFKSQGD